MAVSILASAMLSASTCSAGNDNEKKREKIRKVAAQTLEDLYKREPAALSSRSGGGRVGRFLLICKPTCC